MAVAIRGSCRHCGGTLILPDEDGRLYCLLCRRPYADHRDYGRIGGIQTFLRYGREHMSKIGKRGGRPRLRQLPAPQGQDNSKGGRLPNSLKGLKELYAAKYKRGKQEYLAQTASPGRSGIEN